MKQPEILKNPESARLLEKITSLTKQRDALNDQIIEIYNRVAKIEGCKHQRRIVVDTEYGFPVASSELCLDCKSIVKIIRLTDSTNIR